MKGYRLPEKCLSGTVAPTRMDLVIDDVRRFCDVAQSFDKAYKEAETEARLVLPLLRLLGWSECSGGAEIRRQVTTHGLFADIHLVLDGRVLCVIEVKRRNVRLFIEGRPPRDGVLTALTKAGRETFEQAVAYAVADGVPCAWITNGYEHLVFRVQQPWIPIESRLLMVATETENLLAKFDDLHNLRPTALEALQIVDNIPRPVIGTSDVYDRLVSVCASATRQQLGWLVDDIGEDRVERPMLKYSRSVFVPRERYETIFEEFWRGEAPMLVFTGEAGIGKTSLLCHLALTLDHRIGSVPLIFLDAFHLGLGLHHAVRNTLGQFTSVADPRDVETAVEAVEKHVLSQQPFADELKGEARGTEATHALGLRALLSRLIEPRVRDGHSSYRLLLSWLRDRTSDTALAERLDWLGRAPKPEPPRTRFDPEEQYREFRYHRELDSHVADLLASATSGAINLWRHTRASSDATYMDTLDAIALLHSSRTTYVGAELTISRLQEMASESWLPAAATILAEAPPADLIAAPQQSQRALVHLLSLTTVPKLLLIIDAINECPRPAELRTAIVETASRFQGRLAKVLVSCRTPDMPFFESEALRSLRFRPDDPQMALDTFAATELAAAWRLYSAAYEITGTLGPALTELCRQPLILRIVCESYAGGVVPENDIRLIEIFDGYWQRKVAGGADGPARAIVLHKLAELARRLPAGPHEHEASVVPLALCEGLLENGKSVFDSLISEAVLVFLSPTLEGQSGVRFMYESFHEYVLARGLRQTTHLTARPDEAISSVLVLAREERLLRGALTYLLLWLDQSGRDVSPWLRRLFDAGLVSEAVATVSKLRSRAATVTFVRWLEGQELSRDHLRTLERALAKHVHTMKLGQYGNVLSAALRDPRRATLAIPLALTTIEESLPRIDPDLAAYILGFERLWGAATASQSPLTPAERAVISDSKRADRVERVAHAFRSSDAAPLSWLQDDTVGWWGATMFATLRAEIGETIRVLLNRTSTSLGGLPTNTISVRTWMNHVAITDRSRTVFGRVEQRLLRYLGARPADKPREYIPSITDLVATATEGLCGDIADGSDVAAIFVTRLLRLTARCREFGHVYGSTANDATQRMLGSLALGLYELSALLSDQRPPSVVQWLSDLSNAAGEELAPSVPDALIAAERRGTARSLWRELTRLGSRLSTDTIVARVRPISRRRRT